MPEVPEVKVPKFVGMVALDAREAAAERDLVLESPTTPDLPGLSLEYVVRQYPEPGVYVPWGAVVTVWFDFGGEDPGGGAGVREPRLPGPPDGGLRVELDEPRPAPQRPLDEPDDGLAPAVDRA
ncbi:PASTA domain-containing protein [Streptomyces sp. NPDC060194]|uniref:PASTA domain-containing protein n=1 Tax=Streptomyces sp. NPDC060194 TaxID=3347069 RepID=UPI003651BF11